MLKKILSNPPILSFLALVAFIGAFVYLNRSKTSQSISLINSPTSPDSICFNQDCLRLKDDLWWYQDQFPADQTKVDNFLSSLNKANLDTMVSNNPDKFEQLGFSSDQPFLIKVGETAFELSSSFQNVSYSLIKFRDQNQVYKTDYLGSAIDFSDSAYWQPAFITNLASYQIKKISASNQLKTLEITNQEDAWPQQDYLDVVSHLTPVDYLGQTQPASSIVYNLTITLDDDTNQILTIGQSVDRLYWASIDQQFYYSIDIKDFKTLTSILI